MKGSAGFNLGTDMHDFRVPDGGFHHAWTGAAYVPTATVVIEVLSERDETWQKVDFYRRHGVQELLVAHPEERWVRCYDLVGTEGIPQPSPRSRCLDVAMADVEAAMDWPRLAD